MRICRPLSNTCAITTAITQPCRGGRHPCIAFSSLNHLSESNSNRSPRASSSNFRLFTVSAKCVGYDSSSTHGNRFPAFFSNYRTSSVAASSYPECSFFFANGFSSAPSRTKKKNANPNPSPKPSSSSKASTSPSKMKVSASKNSQSKAKPKTKTTSAAKGTNSKKEVKKTQKREFYDDEFDEDDDDFEDFDEFDDDDTDNEDSEDDLVETKKKSSPKATSTAKKSASKKPQTIILDDISDDEDDEDDEVNVKAKNSAKKKQAKKTAPAKQSKKSIVEEDFEDEDEDEDFDDDEEFDDDDYLAELDDATDDTAAEDEFDVDDDAFIDDMLDEEGEGTDEIKLGDGGDGGGINISQTQWGEQALMIAKEVLEQFGSNFSLYAFKTSASGRVYVRLDKLSDKYGSPTMDEMQSYLKLYNQRLEKAGEDGIIPNNLALEVSTPGAERVVIVPDQLERFKDLPMLVRYIEDLTTDTIRESIFELDSVEVESDKSVWKLANVRANREQAGKGRRLTKKLRELRFELPLSSLQMVRLYLDI